MSGDGAAVGRGERGQKAALPRGFLPVFSFVFYREVEFCIMIIEIETRSNWERAAGEM